MAQQVIDIIIPVLNEEEALPDFCERLSALPLTIRPIFIDNGSTDKSLLFLRNLDKATIIEHQTNLGYGASLRTGISAATSEKIIIIDADGEYGPEVIPEIVKELDRHEIVHSSRFLPHSNTQISHFKALGNTVVTRLFNLLFNEKLTDLYTGCKGYRCSVISGLSLTRNGFEHVLEVSAKLLQKGNRIHEIPVTYRERRSGASKMNHITETVKYCILLLYYFFSLSRTGR